MTHVDYNFLAIVAGALVNMVIGALWYSPLLFARKWEQLTNVDMSKANSPALAMVAMLVMSVLTAFALFAVVSYSGASNAVQGALIGVLVAGGFIATNHVNLVAFEQRPIQLFVLNNANTVLSMALQGAIFAVWR